MIFIHKVYVEMKKKTNIKLVGQMNAAIIQNIQQYILWMANKKKYCNEIDSMLQHNFIWLLNLPNSNVRRAQDK